MKTQSRGSLRLWLRSDHSPSSSASRVDRVLHRQRLACAVSCAWPNFVGHRVRIVHGGLPYALRAAYEQYTVKKRTLSLSNELN